MGVVERLGGIAGCPLPRFLCPHPTAGPVQTKPGGVGQAGPELRADGRWKGGLGAGGELSGAGHFLEGWRPVLMSGLLGEAGEGDLSWLHLAVSSLRHAFLAAGALSVLVPLLSLPCQLLFYTLASSLPSEPGHSPSFFSPARGLNSIPVDPTQSVSPVLTSVDPRRLFSLCTGD